LKRLISDRAKYIGIIIDLTFASLLITQQMDVFIDAPPRTFNKPVEASPAPISSVKP
jgi:putative ABC transport system permease protein